jgi:hypothetical protein
MNNEQCNEPHPVHSHVVCERQYLHMGNHSALIAYGEDDTLLDEWPNPDALTDSYIDAAVEQYVQKLEQATAPRLR